MKRTHVVALVVLMAWMAPVRVLAGSELHWSVCEAPRSLLAKLPRPRKQGVRAVYYFDDHQLRHYRSGVVLRFRWTEKSATATVKVLGATRMPGDWGKGHKCEWDYRGLTSTSSCSLKRTVSKAVAAAYLKGKVPVARLFDEDQRRYLAVAGKGVAWDDLVPAGPIRNQLWGWEEFEAELMQASNGRTLLELSARTEGEPLLDYAKWALYFKTLGIKMCRRSVSKTEWALRTHLR